MNYQECRAYIDDSAKYGSVLGLDNMREMLDRLGNPQDAVPYVHVAGTNGKGSVIAYLYTTLTRAGYKVGRYISPTLYSYRERLEIAGEKISQEDFAKYVTEISRSIDQMTAVGMNHPTPFEIETAAAFLYFKEENCDLVLLETGMGGNLDATNIVKTTKLAILVSISMDHMSFLGNTLGEIAEKKAVWDNVLQEFYTPFIEEVNKALKTGERVRIESKIKCPNCGKPMVLRTSKFGTQFLGCSGYPDCKTMMSLNALSEESSEEGQNKEPEVCEEKCEKCGSDMIFKTGPYGKYMECTNAECKHRKPFRKSTGVKCPKCGEGTIVERKSKRGTVFYGCDKYPNCDFTLWNEPTGEKCPECGSLLVKKILKKGTVISCSSMKCNYKKEAEEATDQTETTE